MHPALVAGEMFGGVLAFTVNREAIPGGRRVRPEPRSLIANIGPDSGRLRTAVLRLTVKELYGKVSSSKYANVRFAPGDRIRLTTPGGGGYGDPRRRDPALVAEDVAEGYVSAEAAQRLYGWRLAPS
jgi:N-methylhydantoinase B/oxoprolinase/acetone carboxylase alpha subunit